MPGYDGVKVDCVFRDEVSVGVGGKDVGGVILPNWEGLKVGSINQAQHNIKEIKCIKEHTLLWTQRAERDRTVINNIFYYTF